MQTGRTMLSALAAFLTAALFAFVPFAAFVAVPLLVALSETLRRRLGWGAALYAWLTPLPVLFMIGDPLPPIAVAVGLAVFLAIALTQKRGIHVCGGTAIGAAILTAVALLLLWSIAVGKDFGTLAADYVYRYADRPLWQRAARRAYSSVAGALAPGQDGYLQAAFDVLAARAAETMSEYAFYYTLGYASLTAVASCLLYWVSVGRRAALKNVRFDRRYLLYVALPVAGVSLLGIWPHMRPLTAAVFYAAITAPCAAVGFTFLLYCAQHFSPKARVPAVAVVVTLCSALYLFDYGQLLLSLFGFADVLIPLRKLIDLI